MAYSNTSEFYYGVSAIDNAVHSTDQNIPYFNQISPNYQIPPYIKMPENYTEQENYNHEENCINQEYFIKPENYSINQKIYPTLTPTFRSYDPAQGEQITHGCTHFYENYSVPQYNSMQYTPRTPGPVSYPVFHLQPMQPYQRKHRAQITILRTSRGNFKAVVKRKRKRTVFTTEQVQALEDIFRKKQYINREERQDIMKKLELNDKAVKIWFQNRRLKNKRMPEESSEESEDCPNITNSIGEMRSPDIARLDLVESQITKKTDEFGYVTLDDAVMGDLVNVIDDFLVNSLDVPANESTESDSSPIYEPISPASLTDSNEEDNSSCWIPSEPDESLQRLFDLQTMLSL